MRNPRATFTALRLATLGLAALSGSSLLAACGGSAGDRSLLEAPSEPGAATDEAGAEQSPARPAEPELSSPRPEPVGTPAQPPARPRCDTTNEQGTVTFIQTQAELEALAGCEVLRGYIQIYISADMDLTALASLRVVDGTLWIGSDTPAPDATPVRLGSLRGLERLERAGELFIQHAEGGLAPLAGLREVEALGLVDLPGVVDLQGLSNVRVSRALSVESMPDLVSLEGAVVAPALDELSAWYMPRLESMAGLAGLESVRSVTLYEVPALSRLGFAESLAALSYATISGAPLLTTLAELSGFGGIEELRISGSPRLADLGGGVASGALRRLYVNGAPLLTTLDPVGGLAGLAELELDDCDGITELDALSASPALTYFSVMNDDGITRLPTFTRAGASMRVVRILNNGALVEGPSFPNLTKLYEFDAINYENAELDIRGNPALASIGSFPRLASASMITISSNAVLESVSLPSLEQLTALRLYDDASLSSLELAIERDLRSVELDTIPLLTAVRLGAPTASLRRLTLRNTPSIDPGARQQLLQLVDESTQLTLD